MSDKGTLRVEMAILTAVEMFAYYKVPSVLVFLLISPSSTGCCAIERGGDRRRVCIEKSIQEIFQFAEIVFLNCSVNTIFNVCYIFKKIQI